MVSNGEIPISIEVGLAAAGIYLLAVFVLAVGFAGVLLLKRSTRGTVIVPVYLALHVCLRLTVFLRLGFVAAKRASRGKIATAAVAGLLLAVLLTTADMMMNSTITVNEILPSLIWVILLQIVAVGLAAIGGWIAVRRGVSTCT